MYEAEAGEISIALLGDISPTRRLAVFREPRYLSLRELLRRPDAVYSNLEGSVHKYHDGGHAQRSAGGSYVTVEPHLLADLKWLGINLLSCGSTHADDYGPAGILKTIDYLDEAGIVHAGSGRHLAEARSPGFLDTPRGRVGLVATTANFNPGGRAGEQRRESLGYPGVNAIRHHPVYEVDDQTMTMIRDLAQAIGWDVELLRRSALADRVPEHGIASFNLLDRAFVPGDKLAFHRYADEADIAATVREVAYAKAMSDRVIVSMHTHDLAGPSYLTATTSGQLEDPPDFMVELAKRSIDAGADVFAGHGPGRFLGIEIYKGKPIFYGLGTFIAQLETVRFLPEQAYERYGLGQDATPVDFVENRYGRMDTGSPRTDRGGAIAVCDFDGSGLEEVRLYPIQLGTDKARSQRGRPMLAEPEFGARMIEQIARLSSKYGTSIDYRDGIGAIRP
jgi:poly-gamma-glutamate capsule biosynthesis protein CapA/YwtB (metallophosphatase superfamily)